MGVKRLKKYLAENNLLLKTNLKDAADAWRSFGGNPILLVDTLNILPHVIDYSEALCCGGEYPALEARLLEIIETFKAISIELVFCIDGSLCKARLDKWKARRVEGMRRYINYFEKIEIRKVGAFAEAELFPFLSPTVAAETAQSHCQFVVTQGDPDQFMAHYIMKNKCMGIVTEDTDFVIYNGIPHVFSPEDLVKNICFPKNRDGAQFNPDLVEATEYTRVKLANSIKLKLEAFPIFATLAGNDFFEYNDIMEYMKTRFGTSNFSKIVIELASLANYIYSQSGGDLDTASVRLSYEMFGSTDMKDLMADSLKSYDLRHFDSAERVEFTPSTRKWRQLVEPILKAMHVKSSTKCILACQRYTQSERFENVDEPCGIILRDFRRRIYSVLLHEKSDGMEFVEEIVATSPHCFRFKWMVGTIKVEVDHPGLWELFFGGKEYDDIRWKLVWWVLWPTKTANLLETRVSFDKFQNLINLPDEMKLIGMSIFYLYRAIKKITEEEASILMWMAAIVAVSSEELREFSMENEITKSRAVHMATLYQQTHDHVKNIAINVCHLNFKFKTSKCYSGHIFHWLYKYRENITDIRFKLRSEVWDKYLLLKATLVESTSC